MSLRRLGVFGFVLGIACVSAGPATAMAGLPAPALVPASVEVLYDCRFEPVMEAMVASARHSVAIDYFVFAGPMADRLATLLIARHRAGVQVRVILDEAALPVRVLQADQRAVAARLRAAGVPFRTQDRRPIPPRTSGGTMDHDKYLVVDGERALVGSANLGRPFERFHDLMLVAGGPVVGQLAAQFDFDWEIANDPVRALPGELVHLADAAPTGVPVGESARVVGTGPGRKTGLDSLLGLMAGATRSVHMQAYELEDRRAIAALVSAHRRGIDVRVLLDPGEVGQFAPIGWAPNGILNAQGLLAVQQAGVPARTYRTRPEATAAHMKTVVVDGDRLLAGSLNFSRGGFEWAYETDLEVRGGRAPAQVEACFEDDWSHHADPAAEPSWLALTLCRYYNWNDGNPYPPGPAWLVPLRK